jgi:hypothetical protein
MTPMSQYRMVSYIYPILAPGSDVTTFGTR